MGIGDDIMFLGEAQRIYEETGKKITPVSGTGWSDLFNDVDFLTKQGGLTVNTRDTSEQSDVHVDYYIKEKQNTLLGNKLVLRQYKPKPYEIKLEKGILNTVNKILEQHNVSEFIMVNPDYKSSFFSENKNWGFKKWQELTNKLSKHIQVVRIHPNKSGYKEPNLKNAVNINCNDLLTTIGFASKAKFGVTFDGMLHHVFAGYKIPSVIICGGLIDQNTLSYDTGLYLSYDHPDTPCGSTYYCPHCVDANKAITVEMVYEQCLKLL